jgi:hypothetical protein
MKFKLGDVVSNPFRDLSHHPLKQNKIDTLVESIQETGWWKNVEGRIVGDKLQVAYGHHRLAALRIVYPASEMLDFIVEDLTDAQMLKRMSRENREDYGCDVRATMEMVQSVVQALAEGKLIPGRVGDIDAVDAKAPKESIRYAPSLTCGVPGTPHTAYTSITLATFLGETIKTKRDNTLRYEPGKRVEAALVALELIQLNRWTYKHIDALADKSTGRVYANRLFEAASQFQTRNARDIARAKVKAATTAEQAHVLQEQLDKINEDKRRRDADFEADVERLADLADEDIERQVKERRALVKEKKKKDAEHAAALKERQKELDKIVEANKKAEAEAEKLRRKKQAEAAAALKATKPDNEDNPNWFPEFTTTVAMFHDFLAAGDAFKAAQFVQQHPKRITADQAKQLLQEAQGARKRLLKFIQKRKKQ